MTTVIGDHVSSCTCSPFRSEAYLSHSGLAEQHKLDAARRFRCVWRRVCHQDYGRVKQLKLNGDSDTRVQGLRGAEALRSAAADACSCNGRRIARTTLA